MNVKAPQAALVVIVLALLAAAPVYSGDYLLGVLTVALIYVIWSMSWDFFTGLSGRENFGYQLFIGVGAYATAFLDANYGISPWFGIVAAVIAAALVGVIIGFPTLRLRGPYFALATLAAAEITQHMLIILWEFTGGEDGVSNLTPLFSSSIQYYYFVFGVTIASAVVLVALTHSRWGLLLRAIRGDEAGCQAAGINVTYYKIAGLVVSAAFAGLGGALFASYQLHVGPNTMSVSLLIAIATMVYVGGLGTVYGAIGGAIVLTLLGELLRDAGEYRLLVYAAILILVIFFMRSGFVAPLWKKLGTLRQRSALP